MSLGEAHSSFTEVKLIEPDQIGYLQKWYGDDYLSIIAKIRHFRVVSGTYVYVDFDDTLCNRGRQLQHPLLQDTRGDAGTLVSIDLFRKRTGNFFRLHFGVDTISKDLSEIIEKKPASILTASAAPGFQKSKIDVSFPHVHRIITKKGTDKPKEILNHILKKEEVPMEIDIFEDRTNNFYGVQDKKRGDTEMRLLSTLFPQTKFTLYYVEYAGREGEPTITTDRIWQGGACTYTYNPQVVTGRIKEKVGGLVISK